MFGRLDYYLDAFSSLSTNKNRNHWPEITKYQAPHKPFLLFSIFDLIASGSITRNFIEPSFELAETFSGYWQRVLPMWTSASMAYPFYFLYTSGFWKLADKPGWPHRAGRKVGSVKQLRQMYFGARFNEDLYPLLVMKSSREKLREAMIQTYFSSKQYNSLHEQAIINHGASNYSATLLNVAERGSSYQIEQQIGAKTSKKSGTKVFGKLLSSFMNTVVLYVEYEC
jgi:putative restriction endonuclease